MVIIKTSATEVSIQAVSPPLGVQFVRTPGDAGTAAYLSVSATAVDGAAQAGAEGGVGLAAGAAAAAGVAAAAGEAAAAGVAAGEAAMVAGVAAGVAAMGEAAIVGADGAGLGVASCA
jgi:type IV secretion system protein TrbL